MTCTNLLATLATTVLIGYTDKPVDPLRLFTITVPKCPVEVLPKCATKGIYLNKCIPETEALAKVTPDGIEYLVPNGKDRLVWTLLKYTAHAPIDPCTGKMVQP